jgi:RNA polymerase sigma factor (sigma-70 family)
MSAPNSTALFQAHAGLAAKLSKSFPIHGFQAQEVEQEALIALWQAACKYDPSKGAFEPFATVLIRNQLRNVFNKAKRDSARAESLSVWAFEEDGEIGSLADTLVEPSAGPLLEAERADIRGILQDELRALNEQQQDVLARHAEGHTFSEIARAEGVSKAAVRQMAVRAADQVRPTLESKDIGVRFSLGRLGNRDHHMADLTPLPPEQILRNPRKRFPLWLTVPIALLLTASLLWVFSGWFLSR